MTTYHGKATKFTIADTVPTVRDLSAYTTDVSINFKKSSGETTAKGSTAQTFVVGFYGAEITVSGRWDDTATSGPDVVLMGLLKSDASSAFVVGMGGTATGKRKYTGVGFVTAYTPSSPLEGVINWSATILVSGAVTEDVS